MNNAFDSIVGQDTIKARLLTSINAPSGHSLIQPLFFGEAGLGKTEIALAAARAINSDFLLFHSPEEFRNSDSAEYQTLINWFETEPEEDENGVIQPKVLVIDECHKFTEKATIAMQRVHSFLLKCLDEQNKGKLIQFDADRSFVYDKSKQVIIMMTNYDNRVNPALASRMDVCRLSPYTAPELELIAIKMLSERDMTVSDEKVLKLLALASRGTARPLDNMVRHLARYGQQTISRELAIKAMIELDMFPRGLKGDEIRLLQLARQPVAKPVARAAVTGLASSLNDSVAFLMSHGLLTIVGPCLKTTDKGKKFVSDLKTNGFIAA